MIYIFMYLVSIVAANLLVAHFGIISTIPVAFALIGLDLTVRDNLHEVWSGKGLVWKMALLILTGSVLSWILNRDAQNIAIASFVAFSGAGLVDTVIYHLLRGKTRFLKVNGSNVGSAAFDTLFFQIIAFGAFAPLIFLGEWVVKTFGGMLWFWIIEAAKKQIGKRSSSVEPAGN